MQHVQLEAAYAVHTVLSGNRNLTQTLDEVLSKHPGFTPQQRGALQDLCYGTIRYYSRLVYMLDRLLVRPVREHPLRELLAVALYQLQYTKAGPYTVVDHAVRATKTVSPHAAGLVNAVLRNFLRRRTELEKAADSNAESYYAYPKWWIDSVSAQYAANAPLILQAGNSHPPMTLRVNLRRTTVADYQARLAQAEFPSRQVYPAALRLDKPVPVDRLPGFADGRVSVQDAGAQYAARLLDVHDGMRVLDACAAPGGKSAHILELASVRLTAIDKDERRLERIYDNLHRLGLDANVKCGDAAFPAHWWDGTLFHRILVDAPCSGSGVIRRHPDIKWLRRPEDIKQLAEQQARILDALWPLLESDGKLLYATCSIFAAENQQIVADFLSRHADARQIPLSEPDMENGQLLPNDMHDGFFYALLCKQA